MSIGARITGLLAQGLTFAETARERGIAGPTVAYHARRSERLAETVSAASQAPGCGPQCPTVDTRGRVERLLVEGHSRAEIARRLRISRSTVTYHARRLGAPVDVRGARRYDWGLVQRYYDEGHSVRDCQMHFGFSRQTWSAAVQRGAVVARPHALPLEALLVAGTYRARHNLKQRLLRSGIKQNRCERCGLSVWRGRPLSLALHHVNGDRYDNRVSNLMLLCPNCHSQTSNYAGRANRRRLAA